MSYKDFISNSSSRLARDIRENKAAVTIQRYYRGYLCRSAYLYVYDSIVLIQSFARGMFARKLKRDLLYRKKTVMIQRWFRRWLARKRYRKYRKSVVLIQCCVRRMIAKRALKKLKVSLAISYRVVYTSGQIEVGAVSYLCVEVFTIIEIVVCV